MKRQLTTAFLALTLLFTFNPNNLAIAESEDNSTINETNQETIQEKDQIQKVTNITILEKIRALEKTYKKDQEEINSRDILENDQDYLKVLLPLDTKEIILKTNTTTRTYQSDLPRFIKNSRLMLPISDISKITSSNLNWIPKRKIARFTIQDTTVDYIVGDNHAFIANAKQGKSGTKILIEKPMIKDQRTYISLRDFMDTIPNLGDYLKYNQSDKTVEITLVKKEENRIYTLDKGELFPKVIMQTAPVTIEK